MAKQKGILPLTGTLDGINFYVRNGKAVARAAGGGFTGKAIKNSPNMDRIRDNNTEFGNTSRVKKIFKDSLFPFFGMQKDETLHSRMMQLFMKIKDCDLTSERGKRQAGIGLLTAEGKQLLTSFDFTPLQLVFRNSVYDAATFTYTIANLDPKELSFTNGDTHLELRLGVLVFDFEELKASLFTSEPIIIAKGSPVTNLSLAPTETPSSNGICIAVLGYRYVQEVNGTFYSLKDKIVYGLRVLEVSSS